MFRLTIAELCGWQYISCLAQRTWSDETSFPTIAHYYDVIMLEVTRRVLALAISRPGH